MTWWGKWAAMKTRDRQTQTWTAQKPVQSTSHKTLQGAKGMHQHWCQLLLPSGTPKCANTGSAASLFGFGAVPSPAPSLGTRLTSTSASSTASCPTRWRAGRSPSRSTRLLRPWHGRRGSLGEKEAPGQTPVGSGCPLGLPRSGFMAPSTHPQWHEEHSSSSEACPTIRTGQKAATTLDGLC